MLTPKSVAKQMVEIGNREMEKRYGAHPRKWEDQQPHAVKAWIAVAKWHIEQVKAASKSRNAR